MPNRDGTGPQGKVQITGKKKGLCEGGEKIPFEFGVGRRCGKGMKRGIGNRWSSLEEKSEKFINKEE